MSASAGGDARRQTELLPLGFQIKVLGELSVRPFVQPERDSSATERSGGLSNKGIHKISEASVTLWSLCFVLTQVLGSSQACPAKGAKVSNRSGVWVPLPVGHPAEIPFHSRAFRGAELFPFKIENPDWQRLRDLPLATGAGSPPSFTSRGMFFQTMNYLF